MKLIKWQSQTHWVLVKLTLSIKNLFLNIREYKSINVKLRLLQFLSDLKNYFALN